MITARQLYILADIEKQTQKLKSMDKSITIEGNRLIAEFMGVKIQEITPRDVMTCNNRNNFKYHTSWDWLMPVVEKIAKIEDEKHWDKLHFNQFQRVLALPIYTPINIVFKEVIKFIQWYNSLPTKPDHS